MAIPLTGPAYPRPVPNPPPVSASRPLVAADGSIITWDWFRTVLSQYANSPRLTAIMASFAEAIDQKGNLDAFYADIWDLDTATGIGLDIWGRIVGVERELPIPDGGYFGFAEALPGVETFDGTSGGASGSADPGRTITVAGFGFAEAMARTFDEASFGTYGIDIPGDIPPNPQPVTQPPTGGSFFTGEFTFTNYRLPDDAFLRLIYAKAAANITDGSIPSLNAILRRLFPGRGNCYVTDVPPPVPYLGFAEALPGSYTWRDVPDGEDGTEQDQATFSGFGFAEAQSDAFDTASFGVSSTITYQPQVPPAPIAYEPGFGFAEAQSPALDEASFADFETLPVIPHPGFIGAPFYAGEAALRMVMTYTFDFPLDPIDYAVVAHSNVLPKSTGVALTIVQN